jgi:hypothetical protein
VLGAAPRSGSVVRMAILRTPDERFIGLPGYPFEPHHVDCSASG